MIDPKKKKDRRRRGRKDGRSHDKKTVFGSTEASRNRVAGYTHDRSQAVKGKNQQGEEKLAGDLPMATGGGEPIPAHHKWTDEKRVIQPRDPKTGHFTYNADAGLSREYPYHGKSDAVPVSVRALNLGDGIIHAGDKVKIGNDVWVVIEDMDIEKFQKFFRSYDPETGEYYLESHPRKGEKGQKLSDYLIKSRGRPTKGERKAGEGLVGHVDLDSLSDSTKQAIAQKIANRAKDFKATRFDVPTDLMVRLDPESEKYKRNKRINDAIDGVTMRGGVGSGAFTGGVHDPEEDFSWVDDADKDPDRFYNDNKEFFDEALNDFNAEMGTNYDAKRFVREYIDHMKKKRDSKNESADNKKEDDE